MNCFMLRQCLDNLQGDNADDINVQVSCACCGSVVKESNIEADDDNTQEKSGGKTKGDLLRSKSSRITRFRSRFSLRSKSLDEKDKGMVEETADIHTPSSSAKDLSQS